MLSIFQLSTYPNYYALYAFLFPLTQFEMLHPEK